MATHYKLTTPSGTRRKFIDTGDGFAEREISDYWFEGCTIELMQASQSFQTDKIRDVSIEEIREKAN